MITVKRSASPFMQQMEFPWVLLDAEREQVIAYFHDEQLACTTAGALNEIPEGPQAEMPPMQAWSVLMCNTFN